jgi:hypothetical protein
MDPNASAGLVRAQLASQNRSFDGLRRKAHDSRCLLFVEVLATSVGPFGCVVQPGSVRGTVGAPIRLSGGTDGSGCPECLGRCFSFVEGCRSQFFRDPVLL